MNYFIVMFLTSIRIIAMLATSPVFSLRQIPSIVKVGISFMIGILITGTININTVIFPSSNEVFIIICLKELIIGASIGFISTLIFNSVRASAQLMDFSIGFSMAQYYDPSTSGNSTPLERFFNWYAIALFFILNFHHIIISAVIKSFDVVPVGLVNLNINAVQYIFECFNESFLISVKLAAPILIILFLTDFTIGLISRAVPQLNIFMLSMPVKLLVGLLAISAAIPSLSRIYIKAFEGMSGELIKLLRLLPLTFILATDDKTEDATSKKLDDARKKGQVPKSVDFNSALILLGVTVILSILSNSFFYNGRKFVIEFFSFIKKSDFSTEYIMNILIYALKNGLMAALPVLFTVMVVGVFSNIVQIGFINTNESLKPDLKRISPIEGFKRIFNKKTLFELLKSTMKIIIIGYVAYSFIKGNIFEILKTSDLNPEGIYPFVRNITQSQLVRIVLIMMLIGGIDFIIQRRQFKKDMKMTKEEVKEEMKQTEGNPEIKSRIKQKQKELAMRRMMSEVPKATVIVTNPTHFAVALKYSNDSKKAPFVVAKGADLVATKIKEIARENNVPIIENKYLARALYAKVEIDDEVPVELYQAVAEIIAYVYSIKKM